MKGGSFTSLVKDFFIEVFMIGNSAAKTFCCEDISHIENYNEAVNSNELYCCHHRLEIQDDKILSVQELIDMGLYYNRPASELIFMKYSEHSTLHGKNRKPESLKRISEKMKGNKNGCTPCSVEKRIKISLAQKGKKLSDEHRRKLSEAHMGHKLDDEHKLKMLLAHKNRHWKLIDGKRVWYD